MSWTLYPPLDVMKRFALNETFEIRRRLAEAKSGGSSQRRPFKSTYGRELHRTRVNAIFLRGFQPPIIAYEAAKSIKKLDEEGTLYLDTREPSNTQYETCLLPTILIYERTVVLENERLPPKFVSYSDPFASDH